MKSVKKLFSGILALCLALSLFVITGTKAEAKTAFAQDLWVNSPVKADVDLYQIITLNGTVEDGLEEPFYQWDSEVAKWLRTSSYSSYGDRAGNVTEAFTKIVSNSKEAKAFWSDLAKAVKDGAVTLTPAYTLRESDSSWMKSGSKFNNKVNAKAGGYLVLASSQTNVGRVFNPTATAVLPQNENGNWVMGNCVVSLKTSDTTITKEVKGDENITTGVGKIVPYEVTNVIPEYPSNVDEIHYVIGDTMGTGLELVSGSVKVTLETAAGTAVNQGTDYTYAQNEAGFKLTFKKDFLLRHPAETLVVSYQGKVTKDAVKVDAIKNKVTLEYNPDPYKPNNYTTQNTETKVYTYKISLDKKDKTQDAYLTGAEFTLASNDVPETLLKFVKTAANTYVYDEGGKTLGATDTLVVGEKSSLKIQGLDTGVYVLKETKAPGGYVKPDDASKVTITLTDAQGDGGKPDGTLDQGTTRAEGTGYELDATVKIDKVELGFTVYNKTAGELNLPVTGGEGIFFYSAVGLAVMGGGIYLFLRNRRKNSEG